MDKNIAKYSGKKVHIEFLRIFACFMVFYNHTDAAIRNVAFDDLSKSRIAAILLFLLCKTAVPIFLLIAGANLKGKKDSVGKSLERIGKVLLMIVVVSIFYHFYYYRSFDGLVFMKELISGKTTVAIWYLYMYLGIMIILPILQRVSFSRNLCLYIFFLHLAGAGLIPFVEYYLDVKILSSYLFMPEISSYVIIFLLGDFLEYETENEEMTIGVLSKAFACGICALGIAFVFAVYKMQMYNERFDDTLYNQIYFTPTILLACSIYIICKYVFIKLRNEKCRLILSRIGSYTLGIYLLGDFLRLELEFVLDFLKGHMSEWIAVLLFDSILLSVGIIIMGVWDLLKTMIRVMVHK